MKIIVYTEPILLPEADKEEVKHKKILKILTPKKLLTTLPVLLVQIKAGNNSYNLKNDIKQIKYLRYQHNKNTKKFHNILLSHHNNGKQITRNSNPKLFILIYLKMLAII